MRRENRNQDNKVNIKSALYLGGTILGIAIIAFVITFIAYSNKLNKNSVSQINTEKLSELVPNGVNTTPLEQASTQIGKSVEESKNEMKNNTNTTDQKIAVNTSTIENATKNTTDQNTTKQTNSAKQEEKETKKEEPKDPTFVKPVEGDIVKDFAKDNLAYSQTLNEWTTHLGIDIKAEKTTVVKAACEGKVKSIKNDPRYGLTVVIEHTSGFTSIYSNLLTAEFVVAGEEVKQGQTIGTVGNTAMFEIADDSHLHFEILKDNTQVDPSIYIK